MAATAKKILADCRTAHDLLETESDAARFRLLWLSSVALLRSVGHVLAKVDSGCDLRIAEAVSAACKRWNADKETNAIFWDFIDEERNNILKEYEIGFLSGPVEVLITPSNTLFALDDNLLCPITEGRFAGEDCRDVLAEAIEWWEKELHAIGSYTGG